MSSPDDTDLPGGWEAAAAEYALGLLEGDDLTAFEAQLAIDPALRDEVAAWQTQFAAMTDDIDPVAPSARVWSGINAALGTAPRPSFWMRYAPWLTGGLVAAGIAAAVLFSGVLTGPPEPHLYAALVADEQGLELLAHWAPDSQTFMLRRDLGAYPTQVSYEIWVIPPGADAPISVGLMQEVGLTQIPVPDVLIAAMIPGTTVAISAEPLGGSPIGAPTGPILATGPLAVRS